MGSSLHHAIDRASRGTDNCLLLANLSSEPYDAQVSLACDACNVEVQPRHLARYGWCADRQGCEQVGCEAITYFAKERLQGFVIPSSGGASLSGHVGFYSGPLQGAAGPHQTQVGQPFLHSICAAQ